MGFIKLLIKLVHLYEDQNETIRKHRWENTVHCDRIAFHRGGVRADPLCRNLFNNKKNTGLCRTEGLLTE